MLAGAAILLLVVGVVWAIFGRGSAGEAERVPVALAPAATGAAPAVPGDGPVVTVYKTPTCGCCTKWIDHLEAHGFEVVAHDLNDLSAIKAEHGVTRGLSSCHTAVVDGYVVEGHVPADVIQRLLRERPEVAGVSVPGMPMGSPGMEGPYTERYDIIAFDRDGRTSIYESR